MHSFVTLFTDMHRFSYLGQLVINTFFPFYNNNNKNYNNNDNDKHTELK